MTNYKKLYHLLFNAITDSLEDLGNLDISAAVSGLKEAQIQAEEIILEES